MTETTADVAAEAAVIAEWWSDGASVLSDEGWEWITDEKVSTWLAERAVGALRSLPVEERMAAMGMTALGGADPHGRKHYVEASRA